MRAISDCRRRVTPHGFWPEARQPRWKSTKARNQTYALHQLARKGPADSRRPGQFSRILSVPDQWQTLTFSVTL
ncbi:hypothetical protein MesoLj131b_21540 [Mesorhizobium sp. 131-2-5]|nr:hypothetical protein MesoLj131b_21540 [Mesorhizobium sp. 131-2-5]